MNKFLSFLWISLLFSCNSKPANNDPKFRQYMVQGEQLYLTHCANCHQVNGTGLAQLYPPLHPSDFVDKRFPEVVCLIRFGISGPMEVNQKIFNQPMPGIPQLSELEIAEILTYIYNSNGREKGLIEIRQIGVLLDSCKNQK